MSKTKQFFFLLVILGLFISGLNTSNEGINHLTLDDRGPVFACNYVQGNLNVHLLSNDYIVSPEFLYSKWQQLWLTAKDYCGRSMENFHRSWLMFKTVFF